MDWWAHRIAASTYYGDGLADVVERWTLPQVLEAHAVLDVYDELERTIAEGGKGER